MSEINKDQLTQISTIQAFYLGKECKQKGFSIHYNPYRNIAINSTNAHVLELETYWIKGYES